MDREQLVQDLLNERSFSTEKDSTGNYVDLRVGQPGRHGQHHTVISEMRSMGARLEGISEADVRNEAEKLADQLISEDIGY